MDSGTSRKVSGTKAPCERTHRTGNVIEPYEPRRAQAKARGRIRAIVEGRRRESAKASLAMSVELSAILRDCARARDGPPAWTMDSQAWDTRFSHRLGNSKHGVFGDHVATHIASITRFFGGRKHLRSHGLNVFFSSQETSPTIVKGYMAVHSAHKRRQGGQIPWQVRYVSGALICARNGVKLSLHSCVGATRASVLFFAMPLARMSVSCPTNGDHTETRLAANGFVEHANAHRCRAHRMVRLAAEGRRR